MCVAGLEYSTVHGTKNLALIHFHYRIDVEIDYHVVH